MDWTRTAVSALLRERGLRLKRSLGQSYLVDRNFLEALARDTGAGAGDDVVEIGSGLGNLTEFLAARARHVWAFEIDPRIHALSRKLIGRLPNVTLVCADGAAFEEHAKPAGPLRIVSNLPYSDWERLVLRALSTPLEVSTYTFMVEADLYERLSSKPGTKRYGPVPALLQGACAMRKLRRAGKGLFVPPPRVDSVVFELRRTRPGLDFTAAEARLRQLFVQRRKKCEAAGGRRVEALEPAELLKLT